MLKNPMKKTEAVSVETTKKEAERKTVLVDEVKIEPTNKIDLTEPLIKEAIAQGKAVIKDGKSKADAARAIYALISDEPKEVIVAAFVEGATLTAKGGLTYFYNCKRRTTKENRLQNGS